MLKLLLKIRLFALMDQFSGQNKGKKALNAGKIALEVSVGVLLMLVAGYGLNFLLGPICEAFIRAGLRWAFYAIVGVLALLLCLMLTMFYAQGAVFEAQDNELLLSMPIRPSAILAGRIGSLYFLNVLICFTILGSAWMIDLTHGGSFSAAGLIILLICILLLALIGTTVSCLVGWLISVITRHLRNKTLFQFLLSLLSLAALYFATSGLNEKLRAIQENTGSIAEAFKGAVYPLYAMGLAVGNTDFVELLLFAACCLIPFGLVYWGLSASFVKIVTARSGAKQTVYESGGMAENSTVWSLTKKDLIRFFNSPPYMLNAGIGLLYVIGISVIALINGQSLIVGAAEQFARQEQGTDILMMITAVTLTIFAAVIHISGPSISVESRNLWILKSMPVIAKDVLTAKVLSHLVLAVPVSLLGSLCHLIVLPAAGPLSIAMLFLMPLAAHVFSALAGVIANLFFGRLDYPSIAKAVKSSVSSLIPMGVTLLVTIGPGVLYLVTMEDNGIPPLAVVPAITGLLIVLDVILYRFLGSEKVQKRWEKLGNV